MSLHEVHRDTPFWFPGTPLGEVAGSPSTRRERAPRVPTLRGRGARTSPPVGRHAPFRVPRITARYGPSAIAVAHLSAAGRGPRGIEVTGVSTSRQPIIC